MAGADDQVHARKLRLEAAEDEREHVRRNRRRGADEQLADASLAKLAQELATFRELQQSPLRVRPEGATRGGQTHAARRAREQVDAELDARGS